MGVFLEIVKCTISNIRKDIGFLGRSTLLENEYWYHKQLKVIKVTNSTKKSNDCKIRLVINLCYELKYFDTSNLFIKNYF